MTIEDQYYGAVSDTYDAWRQNTRTRKAEDAAVARLLDKARDADLKTVLDIPCGTGRWIDAFHQVGIAYTGVDISADMLRHARRVAEEKGAADVEIMEANCFDFLPAHQRAYDLVISTRFINWWDQSTALRILALLCAASRKRVILHVRVDENPLQRAIHGILRYPERLRRALKTPAAVRRARIQGVGRTQITYHNRAAMLSALADAGCSVEDVVVLRKYLYGSVEFWLIKRDRA